MDLSKLGAVYFTVVKEENWNYSNAVTDKPLEDGSTITDHAQSNPIKLSISGVITQSIGYPTEDIKKLQDYSLNNEVLTYIGTDTLANCIIESFDKKHTVDIANGIEFSLSLKEIRVANKQVANISVGSLSIPDIELLKAQQSVKGETLRASLRPKTTKGTQGRKATKLTSIQKIISKF